MRLDPLPEPASSAVVDRAGRLLSADPWIERLNLGAGGAVGEPLAVPQLAAVARLAARLNMPVSRTLLAAEGDADLDLWVRAEPTPEGVRLNLTERASRATRREGRAGRAAGSSPSLADTRWGCDAALVVTELPPSLAARLHDPASGQALTRLFTLLPAADGHFPLLAGLAAQRAFRGQLAELREHGGGRVLIDGVPLVDDAGGFCGFAGNLQFDAELVEPAAAAGDPALADRLDRALRDPLSRILGSAEALGAREEEGVAYRGYAADIESAGRHLMTLVDDLIDLEAIETPDFRLETRALDLADLGQRAAAMLRPRAEEKGIVVAAPGAGERLCARGDERRVLQILTNLADNAIRYSPERSAIAIQLEADPGVARVVVADEGPGIAHADQERVFDRFERLGRGEPGGTGLGLHIARGLARAMGGELSVDSAPGRGARFVLSLPAA